MNKRFHGFLTNGRRLTAILLLSVFFSGEAFLAAPVLKALAIPTTPRVPLSFYDTGGEDPWEDPAS